MRWYTSGVSFSPDGKNLFFSSARLNPAYASPEPSYEAFQANHAGPGGGLGDVYWVDARVVENARAEILAAAPAE